MRLRWKALVFGLSADFLATMLGGLLLSAAGAAILAAQGRPVSDLRAFHLESPFLAAVLAAMCGATFVGGFVAAAVARASPLAHGFAMGVLSLAVGLLLTRTSLYPPWFNALAAGLAIPSAVAGALFAGRTMRPRPLVPEHPSGNGSRRKTR
jgi:hypothetical protein